MTISTLTGLNYFEGIEYTYNMIYAISALSSNYNHRYFFKSSNLYYLLLQVFFIYYKSYLLIWKEARDPKFISFSSVICTDVYKLINKINISVIDTNRCRQTINFCYWPFSKKNFLVGSFRERISQLRANISFVVSHLDSVPFVVATKGKITGFFVSGYHSDWLWESFLMYYSLFCSYFCGTSK